MPIKITPISKSFNLKAFECGEDSLNGYFRFYAVKNDKNNISRTFVAFDTVDPVSVLGYYSVSSAQIFFEDYPESLRDGLPKYPIPAVRIGKLATSIHARGRGVGAALLKDAFLRTISASKDFAIHCILVDALNENAVSFYGKYGFVPIKDILTMVIPIETVKASL